MLKLKLSIRVVSTNDTKFYLNIFYEKKEKKAFSRFVLKNTNFTQCRINFLISKYTQSEASSSFKQYFIEISAFFEVTLDLQRLKI